MEFYIRKQCLHVHKCLLQSCDTPLYYSRFANMSHSKGKLIVQQKRTENAQFTQLVCYQKSHRLLSYQLVKLSSSQL